MRFSTNFSLREFVRSAKGEAFGIDNTPTPQVLSALRHTAMNMELVRSALGNRPIQINSCYRSPALNKLVGGVKNSDHLTGHAVDFVCPKYGSPFDCAIAIAGAGIKFDQLILEYGWIHISFAPRMRGMCLTIKSARAPAEHGLVR